ncbi:MAG: hypothetical protein O9284_17500 [Steroidobacteraceae bacterium]|nr:hypothetical protein [Steroidobacteraceae bacterium]
MKMSGSGICHEPTSPFYSRTTNYEPYPTLAACLLAGGRLPQGVQASSEALRDAAPTPQRVPTDASPSVPEAAPGQTDDMPETPPAPDDSPAKNTSPLGSVSESPSAASGQAFLWSMFGAGALLLAGAAWWWWRSRSRREAHRADAEAHRRWQDHRLSRFDRADEAKLLLAVRGERAVFDRLVAAELERDPQLSREQAISDAYARWRRDNA